MSRRDPLEAITRDAQAEIRAQIAAGGRVRDFAAMIARARALAPDAVSAEAAAEVARYARVVALRRRDGDAADRDDDRVAGDQGAPPRASGGRRAWIAGVAAALLLGLGLAGAATLARREAASIHGDAASLLSPPPGPRRARVGDGGRVRGVGHSPQGSGLERHVDRDMSERTGHSGADDEGDALDGAPGADAAAPAGAPPPPARGPAVTTAAASAADLAPSAGAAADAPRRGPRGRLRGDLDLARDARAQALAGASWEAIDRAARDAWRRGDLEQARALFGVIVAADADAQRVELALGDLLVLARQAGDARGLQRARRDYLRRFPAGTYAEDARAGLCRDGDAPRCWRDYLERWPAGAHAAEARRALDEDDAIDR